jgi:hypothetical protein
MPNHCENDLTIIGPLPDLESFLAGCEVIDDNGEKMLRICRGHYPMPGSLCVDSIASSNAEGAYAAKYGTQEQLDYWLNMPWAPGKGIVDRATLLRHFCEQRPDAELQADCRRDNLQKYGHADWYDWACEKWGTKWGDYETEKELVIQKPGRLPQVTLHFRSAWSPPIPALLHISTKWPTLTFDLAYFESGMGFKGTARIRGGHEHEKTHGKYSGSRGG